jgi:hypothetical protein
MASQITVWQQLLTARGGRMALEIQVNPPYAAKGVYVRGEYRGTVYRERAGATPTDQDIIAAADRAEAKLGSAAKRTVRRIAVERSMDSE